MLVPQAKLLYGTRFLATAQEIGCKWQGIVPEGQDLTTQTPDFGWSL